MFVSSNVKNSGFLVGYWSSPARHMLSTVQKLDIGNKTFWEVIISVIPNIHYRELIADAKGNRVTLFG